MNDPELERKLHDILIKVRTNANSLPDADKTGLELWNEITVAHAKAAILQLLKDEGYEKVPKYPLPGPEIRISGR